MENSTAYPTVKLVELDNHSAIFEVTNSVEEHRTAAFGGEKTQLKQFINSVDKEDVIWDVGANVGLFSIFASRVGADVIAFEPDPSFAQRLQRNRYLNGQDINVNEIALSDENGTATLYSDGVDGMSPGLTKEDGEQRSEVSIRSARGDGLDSPVPDVLKIDVEGAEASVLRGMENILPSVNTVFVEVHQEMLPRFGDSIDTVRELLETARFNQRFSKPRNEQTHYILKNNLY